MNSPSGRVEGSMAYDPGTGGMVLFGGRYELDELNDTWSYSGSTWTEQHPAESPPPSSGPSMAYDTVSGEMVLLVGYANGIGWGPTWTYNGSTWSEHATGNPAGRYGASMVSDPATGQVVLFGGYGESGDLETGYLADTWTYDGSTWSEQHPANSPPARIEAQMAYDPVRGEIVLFGGRDEAGALADTWTYDGTTWTEQHPAESPLGRYGASMASDPATGEVVLFGGASGSGDILGETWTYGLSAWTEQSPAGSPTPRHHAALAYDPETNRMLLFGGFSNDYLNDTWTYRQTKAFPTISTSASGSVAVGGEIHDEALLSSGGGSPGGTIAFSLYGPDDALCESAPAYTSPPVAVAGDGSYESAEFAPTTSGVYQWVASYSGDNNDEAAAGVCGEAGQSVTVLPAPPPSGTLLSSGLASTPIPAGGAATVPGAATGSRAATPPDVEIVGTGNTIAVHGKVAIVPITCRFATPCTGVVALQSFAYNARKGLAYAHTRYTIPAGREMTVALPLGKIGMALLTHSKHVRAYLYLHPSGGLPADTPFVGGEVLLAMPGRHRP